MPIYTGRCDCGCSEFIESGTGEYDCAECGAQYTTNQDDMSMDEMYDEIGDIMEDL